MFWSSFGKTEIVYRFKKKDILWPGYVKGGYRGMRVQIIFK